MPETPESIEDLRRQIDEIDTALHDLLMRRTEVAGRIGMLKGNNHPAGARNGSFLRPAREAAVLRRLLERHHGPLPQSTVVRLWRELMSALLRLQGPLAVAACAPERTADRGQGAWDLAREHFGSDTPVSAYASTRQVLREVMGGQATVGVLPLPQEDGSEPWWRSLISRDARTPRVFARLPFWSNGRSGGAFAIACVEHEPSGWDRTLVVIETGREETRVALRRELERTGLPINYIQTWEEPKSCFYLIELEGFLAADDPQLAGIAAGPPGTRRQVWPIGGYAVPIPGAAADAVRAERVAVRS